MSVSQPFRIEEQRLRTPSRIKRERPVPFFFDGRAYEGFEGETLASALLACGQRLLGRSFKYHRPRGQVALGEDEPNALVQRIDEEGTLGEPNLRATQVFLRHSEQRSEYGSEHGSLCFRSQNRFPSLSFDLGALASWFSPVLVAGFYYKTFKAPSGAWRFYEHFIRRAAGLGKPPKPESLDADFCEWTHHFPDVLVVGSGIAGLEAAEILSRDDTLRITLVEQDALLGGALLAADPDITIDGKPAHRALEERIALLQQRTNLTLLPNTCASGYFDGNFLTAVEQIPEARDNPDLPRERLWRMRARHVLLATGASERHMVFTNNDLPGVMLADTIRTSVRRYAVLPGCDAVIATNNDSAYRAALALKEVGAEVAVADWRKNPRSEIVDAARNEGITIHAGTAVVEAHGKKQLEAITLGVRDKKGAVQTSGTRRLACTLLGCSAGFVPRLHLFSQSGGRLQFDRQQQCNLPSAPAQSTSVAGSVGGADSFAQALSQGQKAAAQALKAISKGVKQRVKRKVQQPIESSAEKKSATTQPSEMNAAATEALPPSLALKKAGGMQGKFAFVDLQNDVTEADIRLAIREGYRSIEHVKRYTTSGMATDQGRIANANAVAIAAAALETPVEDIGTTTYRPPYTPQSFAAFVGPHRRELFHPVRTTPMHAAHVAEGAFFEDVGDWKRPWFYPEGIENLAQACRREALQVRTSAGLFDGSTLGKIDVRGPDAVWLLNMLYTNRWDKLKVGSCRYGVMLNEQGMIFDDGVTARIGKDHFYMTTTTGGAARVIAWIEEWLQTEWPHRKVYATSVTEQWAVCVVGGPNARALLQPLCDTDIAAEVFPFMTFRDMRVAALPARVFRVSFSGESVFEVNVPARYGAALWKLLSQQGKRHDLVKYGTEAVHLLRAEKGFIIPGQDTDGTVTPFDANLAWMVDLNKDDFFGKRSLACQDLARQGRKQLVGLYTQNPNLTLPEGTHLIEDKKVSKGTQALGHITSSYHSPTLDRSIAMALLKDGFKRKGSTVFAITDKGCVPVSVRSHVFFDPKGARMRA